MTPNYIINEKYNKTRGPGGAADGNLHHDNRRALLSPYI